MGELIYKTETESQKQQTNLWLLGVRGRLEGINWETGMDIDTLLCIKWGFPGDSLVKNLPASARDVDLIDIWVRKIPWRRKWQPTPVFLYGKSSILAWKSPMDREAWLATVHGVTKSDMKEQACTFYI